MLLLIIYHITISVAVELSAAKVDPPAGGQDSASRRIRFRQQADGIPTKKPVDRGRTPDRVKSTTGVRLEILYGLGFLQTSDRICNNSLKSDFVLYESG